jgi:hypothetical protein
MPSLSVAPEPLAIWNKKLEGLELWLSKKLKISSQDMYPAAPEHLSEFFLIVKNLDRGSSIVFLGSQIYIQCWWWLAIELNSLQCRYILSNMLVLEYCSFTGVSSSYCFLSFH